MVLLNRIYTRTGDGGRTRLVTGEAVSKASLRVCAYGEVDELNAVLGLARLELEAEPQIDAMLLRIQNDLFDLGADLCLPWPDPEGETRLRMQPSQVARLEREIDAMNDALEPLTSFILPGGAAAAAHLHLARTVVRRAERDCWTLAAEKPVNPAALHYLNRLSDHLFVMARWINVRTGAGDVLWKPGAER